MKNEEKQDSSYITTFTNVTTVDSSTFTIADSSSSIDYTIDNSVSDWIFTDNIFIGSSGTVIYTDPYQELEEAKQQQEKEEELRKENVCLQKAWDEYQLILKLLEENECDKFLEERYGMKHDTVE